MRPLLLLPLLLLACTGEDKTPAKSGTDIPKGAVATINGRAIPQRALLERLKDQVSAKQLGRSFEDAAKLDARTLRAKLEEVVGKLAVKRAVNHLVFEALADDVIAKAGVKVSDTELKARLEAERQRYAKGGQAAFMSYEQDLKSRGSSLERRKRDLKREIGLDKVLGKVSERDLRAYVQENIDDYSGRKVELFHILLASKAEAQGVLALLKGGQDFKALAKTRSIEKATARQGGRVAWIRRRGDVPDALAKAAFALKPGEPGGPVKTVYGWHVFKIGGERKGKAVRFDDVKALARLRLEKQRRVNLMVTERAKARVQVVK